MPPNQGLVHLKEYDVKDSNVELIGTDIDHRVKYNSASTEPAWNDGTVGKGPGLFVWRIENFEVVPWPKDMTGLFLDGDSFIVLHSYKVGNKDGVQKLGHEIFFWLGDHTSQDEAGTAAYKTVELDEFLNGAAIQHRELQSSPSNQFLALFPRFSVRSGGIKSGFRHIEEAPKKDITTLLRVFTNPGTSTGVVVHEVEPSWRSLDDGDVFVLDKGDKIWVWQGKNCSPMEKGKAAQVVHEMTLAKHIDVEVISQTESRSHRFITQLGGDETTPRDGFQQQRPWGRDAQASTVSRSKKLFRISDASGQLSFDQVSEGSSISKDKLDGNDVFLFDGGSSIWVWEGQNASQAERKIWLNIAQQYIRNLQSDAATASSSRISKVVEGNESPAFWKAIAA